MTVSFLKNWCYMAWTDFQSCGNKPISRDCVNSIESGIHICSAASLRAISGQPSGPGDFPGLMSSSFLYTM